MEDAFFSQLDGNAVRELLLRTELRHAALFAVSDTLRIERCSDAAQQLSGLHPMEELDPFLSGSTRNILLRCINTQSACTAEEDIDGTVYTVEMIPHRGGALLAYLRRDRAAYDGSLRVIQDKSSRYLGALMAEAEQVKDPALADGLRRQCMRLYRLLTHSDLLHDPLLTEQLSLRRCDLSALCRDAVQQAQRMREEAEAKAKAEAEAAQKAAEEEAKAQAEAEQNADITLVDALPGTTAGYGFGDATATPEATATPVPEATLPPTNP